MKNSVSSNPYAAPSSIIDDGTQPANGATAIFIGAAIGYGFAYAALSLCSLVFLWILKMQGVPLQEMYARAYQATSFLLFAHLVGLLCLLPGGYWCARISQTHPFPNALSAGALISTLSIIMNFYPYDLPIPFWSRAASAIIPIPAFLLGAFWRQHMLERSKNIQNGK